jgi:hypothetical protein
MEEEDLPFQTPFFLQSANNTNPKQQKQPKTSISKCNCNPSSSITQQKNCTHKPYKHPNPRTNPPPSYAQNSSTSTVPKSHNTQKKYRLTNPKKNCAHSPLI